MAVYTLRDVRYIIIIITIIVVVRITLDKDVVEKKICKWVSHYYFIYAYMSVYRIQMRRIELRAA